MSTEEKKAIDPKLYRKILNGLQLKSLSVKNGKFSSVKGNFAPNSEVVINDNARFKLESKDVVKIIHNYKLSVMNGETKKNILRIDLTFELRFSSKSNFTEDFFELYKKYSLPINTWPYFREYVNNITLRMNFPPLLLPLFKGKI